MDSFLFSFGFFVFISCLKLHLESSVGDVLMIRVEW